MNVIWFKFAWMLDSPCCYPASPYLHFFKYQLSWLTCSILASHSLLRASSAMKAWCFIHFLCSFWASSRAPSRAVSILSASGSSAQLHHTHTYTCREQSADSYDTDNLCHNLLAITDTHTALGPIHSIAKEHCSTKTPSPPPPAHMHTHRSKKNVQSRGESSTSAECAAAVGSGAQGRGIRWVLMSSRLVSRPLQFCCSIRASVQQLRKKQPVGTHTQDSHPPETLCLLEKSSCKQTLHYNPWGGTRTKSWVFACVRPCPVSALCPESLRRLAVDLGGWGFGGGVGGVADLRVCVGGG